MRKIVRDVLLKFGVRVSFDIPGVYRDLDCFRVAALALSRTLPKVRFLQIGANDGVSDDPIHELIKEFNWTGVCIEPNPMVFKNLVRNRSGFPEVYFANIAVSNSKGFATLYVPKVNGRYSTGQASFSKLQVQRELGKNVIIDSISVATDNLSGVLLSYNFEGVDLLQVDVEGYDFEVLRQYDFNRNRPSIIHFEHCHLVPRIRSECFMFLRQLGYQLTFDDLDTTAVHESFLKAGMF